MQRMTQVGRGSSIPRYLVTYTATTERSGIVDGCLREASGGSGWRAEGLTVSWLRSSGRAVDGEWGRYDQTASIWISVTRVFSTVFLGAHLSHAERGRGRQGRLRDIEEHVFMKAHVGPDDGHDATRLSQQCSRESEPIKGQLEAGN
jgi:hypothetical protein